jgi:hypothetical protein
VKKDTPVAAALLGAVSIVASTACGSAPLSTDTKDGSSVDAGGESGRIEASTSDRDSARDGAGKLDGNNGSDAGDDLFATCSLSGGCIADCSPPAEDPIATGTAKYDQYDGCILAAMKLAKITEIWQGQLLKAQADNESGIVPKITTDDSTCGGENCGIWAISAGEISGDSPPGPCGSSATDPSTGQVDYSHSYGLWQQTPACEGTFLEATLPSGYACTPTTKANNVLFGTSVTFYCESQTSLGVMTPTGVEKGYINAVQDASSPHYAKSIFNPAYQIYVYLDHTWELNFEGANAKATGCSEIQQWYLSLAYWLTGDATKSCTPNSSDGGLAYVRSAIANYEELYGKAWPYPGP